MPDKKCNKCGGVHAAPRGKKCTVGDEALDGVTLMDTLLNRISQLESAMEVHAKNNVTDEDIDDVPDQTQEDLQVGTNQKKTVTTNSLSNDDEKYAIILQNIEQRRITWYDTSSIADLRRTYTQRSAPPQSQDRENRVVKYKSESNTPGPLYCWEYQDGRCRSNADHDTTRGFVRHVCAFCIRATGALFRHPESECNKKRSKNGGAPQQGI